MTPQNWQGLSRTRPSVVALGNFDGMHLGHRRLLESLQQASKRLALDPVVLTFEPHPRHFLFPEKRTVLLTPPREKAERLAEFGVEVITMVFDNTLAQMSGEDFIRVLVERLQGQHFLLGPGHRFGKNAKGDAQMLERMLGSSSGNKVKEIPPEILEGGMVVSSSHIRRFLEEGQIEMANRMLGRPYFLRGKVIRGEERGKSLGFPTANLWLEDERKALPAFGVYGGRALFKNQFYSAVANLGVKPTFSGHSATIEIHLLEFTGDLYGEELGFEVQHFLRPEQKFASIEALRAQIGLDIAHWSEKAAKMDK